MFSKRVSYYIIVSMNRILFFLLLFISNLTYAQITPKGYNIIFHNAEFKNKETYQVVEFGHKLTSINAIGSKGTKKEPFNFNIHECFTKEFTSLVVQRFAEENGFYKPDSLKSFIKDATRDLYVDIVIDSAWLLKSSGNGDVQMALKATYKLSDVNGRVINTIQKLHDGPGRNFGPYGYPYGDAVRAVYFESIEQQLFALANTEKINDFLTNPSKYFPVQEQLTINSFQKSNSVANAVTSTLTISTELGHGSGVLISPDGYVLTSLHVVSLCNKISVTLNDGESYKASVVRTNAKYDIALLKVETKDSLPYISLASLPVIEFGEDVFAIGTPADVSLGQTMNKGIVSGIRKMDKVKVAQTDVSVSPGNSGGPLVNKSGGLIGIVDSKISGKAIEGIAFALSAEDALKSLYLDIKP